jgi:hypothetical protein
MNRARPPKSHAQLALRDGGLRPGPGFNTNAVIQQGVDVPGADYRLSNATVPGPMLPWGFIEYRNIERQPVRSGIFDPGRTGFALLVSDADAIAMRAQAEGGTTISRRPLGSRPGYLLLRDPNNFLLELAQA